MDVPDVRTHVLDHPDKMFSFWSWLTRPGRSFVAVDTETTGLDWSVPGFKVRMIQFGDEKDGWAIPFQGWRDLIAAAFDWCSRARVYQVWHNIGYDSLALRLEGIELDWSIQADTFVLAALGGYCDEPRALKACGIAELGPWAGVGERVLKRGMDTQGWTWENVPFGWRPYPLYGALDTVVTALLWIKWQDRYRRWREMHDLEVASIRVVNDMAWNGLAVDIPYLDKTIKELNQEESGLITVLASFGVHPSKNFQVIKALEAADAFPPDSLRTKTGQLSVAAGVLNQIDHPIARGVVRYRWVHRVRVSYLQAMRDGAGSGNLVHPGIKSMEAKTGRMSIENPPMQQLPDDVIVRRAVIGREEDHRVITSDWSQIELRIWGSINHDQNLIDAIKEADQPGAADFFTMLCRQIYHEPGFIKGDHRRTFIKSSTYAKLFGGGIEVAAATAGVSVSAMVPAWRQLGERFPSMAESGAGLIRQRTVDGQTVHYAMSPFDRRFAVKDPREARKIPNYDTQGTAAIALKKGLVGCQAVGLGPYLMLPVHDEIMASAPEKEAAEVMHELGEVMNSIITEERWKIGVPADPGMGMNWAEAKSKDSDSSLSLIGAAT